MAGCYAESLGILWYQTVFLVSLTTDTYRRYLLNNYVTCGKVWPYRKIKWKRFLLGYEFPVNHIQISMMAMFDVEGYGAFTYHKEKEIMPVGNYRKFKFET